MWEEFAACISEGFCPACRKPFTTARAIMRGRTWAACRECRCIWEYDRRAYVPVIIWDGGHPGWHVYSFSSGHTVRIPSEIS